MDWGIVFGLTGVAVGAISLVYARTQAVHVQRQADAAHLATTLELQRAMTEKIYKARMDMVTNPTISKEYFAANPALRELYPETGDLSSIAIVRNAIDGLQDIYFLRKQGIVQEYQWKNWASSFVPISRMPIARKVFENARQRDALNHEFADFLAPLFDGGPIGDPKAR